MGLLPRTIGRLFLTACTLAALSSSCAALEEKVCLGTNRGFEEPTNYDTYLREMRDRYTGCTFVQGNLELTWLRSGDLDISFLSNIHEVSGYVLLFNVGVRRVPLTSLQIIRGEKLMKMTAQREAFAFLATTVTSQYLEMPALREIRRGIVGFLQCYNLCHIKDIEWKYINPDWRSNIFDITSDTECSPCDATCSGECWGPGPQNCQMSNNLKCHSECPGRCFGEGYMDCCHSYCSIGCTGSLLKDCIACKHFINDGRCVISCPRGKYKYGATCVNDCPHPMLKENDACVPVCPPGKRAVQGECITCEGHCHKVCEGVGVIHSGNVRSFQNCTTIQGSLDIKNISFTGFQKFHTNFVPGPLYEEMHPDVLEVFNTVKEITGHLSVSGSHPSFKDLSFFRSLEVIGGDVLTNDEAALSIVKTSLKTLGLRSLRTVPKGNIIIRENKDLCLFKQRVLNEIKKSPTHSVEIQGNLPKNDCKKQGYLCHEQCSSDGCWGTKMNECYSCSNYKLKESCIGPCLNSSEKAGGMHNDDEICFTKAFLPGFSLYIIDESTKELVDGLAWDDKISHAYVITHKQYQIWMQHLAGRPSSSQNQGEDIKKCPNRQINWVDDANRDIPQGGFLGGTDTKCMLYVGRTRHDGELLPGKVCPRYHSIYVSWRGREHEYHNYQVLTGSNFEWVLSSGTRIPACAVEGGMLKDGTPVYIGRTYNAGALDIGRVNPTDGNLYIGYYGKEYNFTAYEILVFKSQESIDNDADAINSNKCSRMTSEWEDVPTGYITTERLVSTNNSKCNHYVGRATHDGDVIPGKFILGNRNVYIAWGGQEIAYPQLQLLIGDNYEWIPATRGKIPDCAVKGGQTIDGTTFYIGKAFNGDCEEIGKVNPVDGLLYVAFFNKEYTFTEYDILIYKTSPTSHSPVKTKDIETIHSNKCSRITSKWEDLPTGNIKTERLVSTNDSKCNHYVGRTTHDGDVIPGKFFLGNRNIYIAWGGQEIAYTQLQLLIGDNYEWIPATRGNIPDCAVKGGQTVYGTTLYIGKAFNGDCEEIGKVNPVDGLLYVGYFNKEYTYAKYDILVYKAIPEPQSPVKTEDIETIHTDRCSRMTSEWEDVPTGNILSERLVSTNDSRCNFYVGRATHNGDLIPGKYFLGIRNVYIAWGGQEIAYQQAQEGLRCPGLKSSRLNLQCFLASGEPHPCDQPAPEGTIATYSCRQFYVSNANYPNRGSVCLNSRWSTELLQCVPECGIAVGEVTPLVVNGTAARYGEWPWQVALYVRVGGRGGVPITWDFQCGGSLVAENIVLTAAHCVWGVKTDAMVAAIGKYYRDYSRRQELTQMKELKEIIMNPSYLDRQGNYDSDIALIVLISPVLITAVSKPVCLDWDELRENVDLSPPSIGTVVGWGVTENDLPSETPRKANLPVINFNQCIKDLPMDFGRYLRSTTFCAGYLNRTSVCNGDSGGGLMFQKDDGSWVLQGVVSVSPRRMDISLCDPRYYAIFTRVSKYIKWAINIMAKHAPPP